MSLRDAIKNASRAPVQKEIEGLGVVYIRRLSLGETDALNKPDAKVSTPVRLISFFVGDETGAPLYDLKKPEDVQAIQDIPALLAAELLEHGNAVNVPKKKEDVEKKD